MTIVTVNHEGSVWKLLPGDDFSFGRHSSCDLVLSDWASLSRCAGIITVNDAGWTISNQGTHLDVTVREVGGGGVVPRKAGDARSIAIPFDHATVEVPDKMGAVRSFGVSCDRAELSDGDRTPAELDDDTTTKPAWRLAKNTKRFAALVALSEPQLRDPQSDHLPTYAQVAHRVSAAKDTSWRERRAYEQLAEVARLLGLRESSGPGAADGGFRQDLVSFAIHTGIVRPSDLSVLEPDSARQRREGDEGQDG